MLPDYYSLSLFFKGLPIFMLTRLLDKFKLHWYVNSDNLSFHFKFEDAINGRAEEMLSDENRNIDKKKFIKWWLAPVNEIRPI